MIAGDETARGTPVTNPRSKPMGRFVRTGLVQCMAASLALGLGGCVSLGGAEPPDSLLTLTASARAPVGMSAASGRDNPGGAIAVLTPEVPAKLDVLRVPVAVSDTQIAYVQDAFWVEKPARLFRRLLGETLRARTGAMGDAAPLVLDSDDTPLNAQTSLRGTLIEMGYDAPTSSVVVRYDAIRADQDGNATTRRFEARESGIAPQATAIGPALNRAANSVAGEVAEWMVQ